MSSIVDINYYVLRIGDDFYQVDVMEKNKTVAVFISCKTATVAFLDNNTTDKKYDEGCLFSFIRRIYASAEKGNQETLEKIELLKFDYKLLKDVSKNDVTVPLISRPVSIFR